jgi:O-methyltransferase
VPRTKSILGAARARVSDLARRARLSPVARRVRDQRLTYLSARRLSNLGRCAAEVNRSGVPGAFVEAGVALGGSSIVLASLMGEGRRFHGYDVFGQIPPPSEEDDATAHERYEVIAGGGSEGIDGDRYYGYMEDLREHVERSFWREGLEVDGRRIALHEGLFEDTLRLDEPVALAHIDADWYDPVRTCLERLHPVLSPGGYLVLDDYNDYGGCRRAADEFLARCDDVAVVESDDHLVLRRSSA